MTVRSQDLPSRTENQEPKKHTTPRIGFISVRGVERAFMVLLYTVVLLLVLISVVGTFYGMRGMQISFRPPWQFARDAYAAPLVFVVALVVQGALSLAQYGARVMARKDRRWWLLYLATLAISVYYNYRTYYAPLVALEVPPFMAVLFILAGDVLPEFIAIKHE